MFQEWVIWTVSGPDKWLMESLLDFVSVLWKRSLYLTWLKGCRKKGRIRCQWTFRTFTEGLGLVEHMTQCNRELQFMSIHSKDVLEIYQQALHSLVSFYSITPASVSGYGYWGDSDESIFIFTLQPVWASYWQPRYKVAYQTWSSGSRSCNGKLEILNPVSLSSAIIYYYFRKIHETYKQS